MIRHGDILLRPVPAPGRPTTGAPGERLVLMEGEATGHAHVLYGLAVAATDYSGRGPRSLVQVLEPAALRHEEHKEIAVPPGWYEIIRQRVYTPTAPVWVRD